MKAAQSSELCRFINKCPLFHVIRGGFSDLGALGKILERGLNFSVLTSVFKFSAYVI